MESRLSWDVSLARLGRRSLEDVVASAAKRLEQARVSLVKRRERHEQGWFDLPSDRDMPKRIDRVVDKMRKWDTLLVLGIGGSDLGARALLQALPANKRVLFAGANTDPDELAAVLSFVDLKKTAVNIVSKSGDTIEPMSAFLIIREMMERKVGKKFADQIVATTDASEGTLHAWAKTEGYTELIVPENVGGRFSVLSDVGLFPAAWAGISIDDVLSGAASQTKSFEEEDAADQMPAQYAALLAEAYLKQRRHMFVLMPYVARLYSFGLWYRQLIAESLGKTPDVGPTPIAGLGATDQHSQIQLYADGPDDKFITFLELEAFDEDIPIPELPVPAKPLEGLAGRTLQEVIHAERRTTAEALAKKGRPNLTLALDRMDAFALGELFQFFMLTTAYLGELLGVNAYDQPGVQGGKRLMQAWLKGRA